MLPHIIFGDYFDYSHSHGKHNLFKVVNGENRSVPSGKSCKAKSKGLSQIQRAQGPTSLSLNRALGGGNIPCFSALPFLKSESSSGKPNSLIHKLLLFQCSLHSCLNISTCHLRHSSCCLVSRSKCWMQALQQRHPNQLAPSSPVALAQHCLQSCSFSNLISYFNSMFSSYKAAVVTPSSAILHKAHYAETWVLALNLVFSWQIINVFSAFFQCTLSHESFPHHELRASLKVPQDGRSLLPPIRPSLYCQSPLTVPIKSKL